MASRLRVRGFAVLLALTCVALAASGAGPAISPDAAVSAQSGQGSVTDVTLENSAVQTGETVRVTAIVENTGAERATIPATLTLDGESVATREPSVDPEFPVVVTFEVTVSDAGEYTVAVNGVDTAQTLTVTAPESSENGDNSNSGNDGVPTEQSPTTVSVDSENVSIESVELGSPSAAVGETVEVTATLVNTGPEVVNVSVALEFDGEVVTTATAENILSQQTTAGVTIPYTFTYKPQQAGTYTVSVNGTEAGTQLDVSGGGGLFGFLPNLPLGFLPLGLLRTVALFVLLPIAAVYLVLKAMAIYLGY
ncbi:hypothetical protein [Halovenus halobia]|uniref:hypothetical protein n=1 Tax=Halovenus halobia TaxID=3396622 RepID=UPI003F566216